MVTKAWRLGEFSAVRHQEPRDPPADRRVADAHAGGDSHEGFASKKMLFHQTAGFTVAAVEHPPYLVSGFEVQTGDRNTAYADDIPVDDRCGASSVGDLQPGLVVEVSACCSALAGDHADGVAR